MDAPTPVEMDPRIAFGRPVLVGRGVPTAVLADRFKAGDTMTELAADFEVELQGFTLDDFLGGALNENDIIL